MSLDISLSPETRALFDALREVPLGAEISYSDLSSVIGRDVTQDARPRLVSALRIALRDDGAAFQTIRGVGLRRLVPDEAPDIGRAARRRLRRTSQRAIQGMSLLAKTSNGLTPDAQRKLSAEISTHGLLAEIATDKAVARQSPEGKIAGPIVAAKAFLQHIGAKRAVDSTGAADE